MKRILFVCLGNICRSPMAEFILKDMAEKAGRSADFHIESAGTFHEGGPVYPSARRKLAEHGISCEGKFSRQFRKEDYDRFDLLIGMDSMNLCAMRDISGGDPAGKLHLLLDYTSHPRSIEDPWYTGDFDTAWRDIEEGCRKLFEALMAEACDSER